eukprot:2661772-Pyramimonas_sp.AAC.1
MAAEGCVAGPCSSDDGGASRASGSSSSGLVGAGGAVAPGPSGARRWSGGASGDSVGFCLGPSGAGLQEALLLPVS